MRKVSKCPSQIRPLRPAHKLHLICKVISTQAGMYELLLARKKSMVNAAVCRLLFSLTSGIIKKEYVQLLQQHACISLTREFKSSSSGQTWICTWRERCFLGCFELVAQAQAAKTPPPPLREGGRAQFFELQSGGMYCEHGLQIGL